MNSPETALHVSQALTALTAERWPIAQARERLRPVPGLYAIYGDAEAWKDLNLDPQPNSALYVGKSEDNLVRRELNMHFAADPDKMPSTGSSTVRRSFAALLREALTLQAIPRNPEKPGYFAHYGLTLDGDARLTAWMHQRLSLAAWEKPDGFIQPLVATETAVILRWTPPLNISNNPKPLRRLRLARAAMALEASNPQAKATSKTSIPIPVRPALERTIPVSVHGPTPVELARELGKSPKTVRQALRDKYGKLPFEGGRWGSLAPDQVDYLRARYY